MNYLLAGGGPQPVNMERIPKFVTRSEVEPLLGYGVSPHVTVNSYMASFFPTNNTVTNRLTLATGDCVPGSEDESYNIFDLAFVNDYFGSPGVTSWVLYFKCYPPLFCL